MSNSSTPGSPPTHAGEAIQAGKAVSSYIESVPALAFASALLILGTLSTLITPALLQGWGEQLGWNEARLGWVASVELAGLAGGAISAFYWQRRSKWRVIGRWAIMLLVAANLACLFSDQYQLVCLFRFLSGVAGGVLAAIYTACLSNTRSPERVLAATTLAQIVAQAVFMTLASVLLQHWGMAAIYILFSLSVLILLPAMHLLPVGWPGPAFDPITNAARPLRKPVWGVGLLVLGALVPFEMFQGGAFAFMHEFGERAAGLDAGMNLQIIGISAVGSGLGPLAAYFLGERAGVLRPLGGSLLVMTVMTVGLTAAPYSTTTLLFYLIALQAAWLFAICYLYAGIIKINNELTQAGSPLSSLSLAGGAAVMGYAIERQGLTGILWIAVICMVLTALLALPPLAAIERQAR